MKTLSLLLPVLLVVTAQAQQATDHSPQQSQMSQTETGKWDEAVAAGRIEPGMPAHLAIGLLGRTPDDTSKVGACGMMDVLTWQQDKSKVRLITLDGVVTSVSTAD